MWELTFDEIKDWQQFEELVAAYFRRLIGVPAANVLTMDVQATGDGPDAGKDMVAEFMVPDFIKATKRKWLIQCKFHKGSVSTDALADTNIPTLIHSYGADGYLLILRGRPTNKLVEYFRRLTENCDHGYNYEIWNGEQFKQKLLVAPKIIHQQFFPQYFNFLPTPQKKGGTR